MKQRSIAVVAVLLVFSLLLGSCGPKTQSSSADSSASDPYADLQEESCPHISGTFIQSWLCSSWSDERWTQELTHYQQIGIKYIILGDSATFNTNTQKWDTYYPSQIEGLKDGTCYSKTLFDVALRNCQKFGMKVFIGMGLTNGYEANIFNSDWLTPAMEKCNDISTELYTMYHQKYSDTFYGWYWPFEIWNADGFKNDGPNIKTLADAMSICLDHINELNPDMPMLWSPYVNPSGLTAEETYEFWCELIKEGHFRAGDIICPMDSINNFKYTLDGKAGCTIENIDKYEEGYRRAVDDSGKGVKYWSNCESFSSSSEPAEPALWARYVRQMQTVSKYTDTIVAFAYAHYQSPYNVNNCISDTYLDYLKNGKLETEPPTKPANLKLKMQDDVALISWDPSTDNIGVAGYYIYRNGTQLDHFYAKLQCYNYILPTQTSDWNINNCFDKTGTVTYEVMAYDSAGNYSEKATLTVTQDDLKNY